MHMQEGRFPELHQHELFCRVANMSESKHTNIGIAFKFSQTQVRIVLLGTRCV